MSKLGNNLLSIQYLSEGRLSILRRAKHVQMTLLINLTGSRAHVKKILPEQISTWGCFPILYDRSQYGRGRRARDA